tara:strand:+ start:53 stop:856 length:804 start_codon:yes stop_codon:yes gene_type:complete
MVNIDTVYQRVQALSNKEQRGYLTPQEFNLFANQAQMEIFEQYFYDLNQAARAPGNDKVIADVDDMLEEKISIFEVVQFGTWVSANMMPPTANGMPIPAEVYRLEKIFLLFADTLGSPPGANATPLHVPVEIMSYKEVQEALLSPLTRPTPSRPIGSINGGGLLVVGQVQVLSNGTTTTQFAYQGIFGYDYQIQYIRRPINVSWNYFVVGEKALYNANNSTNFELHPSEETELVFKILKYSGVSMKRVDLMRIGQVQEQAQQQQEKQ